MEPNYDRFGLPVLDCEEPGQPGRPACCLRTCSDVCFVAGACVVALGVVCWAAGRFIVGAVSFGAFCVFAGLITLAVPFIRCAFYRKEIAARSRAIEAAVATATACKVREVEALENTLREKDAVIADLTDEVAFAQADSEHAHELIREALEAEAHLVRRACRGQRDHHIGDAEDEQHFHRAPGDAHRVSAAMFAASDHADEVLPVAVPASTLSCADMLGGSGPRQQKHQHHTFTMEGWNAVRDSL
jgi:hypothetical protein